MKRWGDGIKCENCNGTGRLEYCPPRVRSKWCADLGFCLVCDGRGYVPLPNQTNNRETKAEQYRQSGYQDL
jgi:hypothetical protein